MNINDQPTLRETCVFLEKARDDAPFLKRSDVKSVTSFGVSNSFELKHSGIVELEEVSPDKIKNLFNFSDEEMNSWLASYKKSENLFTRKELNEIKDIVEARLATLANRKDIRSVCKITHSYLASIWK